MTSVKLHGVSKTYAGPVTALHDVDLAVDDQEFVALVGPSGCGKSSLLRVICGLETPDTGVVEMDHRAIENVAPHQRDIAMVFQGESLYPHFSVFDNLAFPLRMRHVAKHEVRQRIATVAAQFGIEDLLQRKPHTLSGGQRQRVALGRALVRQPKLFLLDEPFSHLDAHLRGQLRDELRQMKRHWRTTTIFVTHDQQEAMLLGDRVAVMSAGQIRQCDPPQLLLDKPADRLVASFIGDPPMNFLTGRLGAGPHGSRFRSEAISFDLSAVQRENLPYSDGPICLGIRPESIGPDAATDADESVGFSAVLRSAEKVGVVWDSIMEMDQTRWRVRSVRPLGQVGSSVRLLFDPSSAYFFAEREDACGGRNLMIDAAVPSGRHG